MRQPITVKYICSDSSVNEDPPIDRPTCKHPRREMLSLSHCLLILLLHVDGSAGATCVIVHFDASTRKSANLRARIDDRRDDRNATTVGHAFSKPFCIILCLCHSQFVNPAAGTRACQRACVRAHVCVLASERSAGPGGRLIEALPDKMTSNDISVHQSARSRALAFYSIFVRRTPFTPRHLCAMSSRFVGSRFVGGVWGTQYFTQSK